MLLLFFEDRTRHQLILKLIQEKYNLGSASILELIDAQASSISAKSTLIRIKYDALIEEAQINALLGKLDYNYK